MSETETRERLTDEERETLYAPGRRMDAYYYSFDPTDVPAIDAILSAVAHAGKGYHHTENWSDAGDEDFPGRWGAGRSCIDVIQAAANEAAESVAELSRLRGVVEAVQAAVEREIRHMTSVPYPLREDREAVAADLRAAIDAALAPVSSSGEGTHTRTSTGGYGPDYCAECSEAAQEWVKWPCPSSSGEADGPRRYDQCDGTCTVDCGHCKGQGRPSGEAESGEAFTPADLGQEACPTHGIPDCSPLLNGCSCRPTPVPSGGQADGEGEDVRERVAQAILRHFGPPESGGGSWRLSPYKAADDVLAILAARPVLSREALAHALIDQLVRVQVPNVGTATGFLRRESADHLADVPVGGEQA